jgi:hypothetical protein
VSSPRATRQWVRVGENRYRGEDTRGLREKRYATGARESVRGGCERKGTCRYRRPVPTTVVDSRSAPSDVWCTHALLVIASVSVLTWARLTRARLTVRSLPPTLPVCNTGKTTWAGHRERRTERRTEQPHTDSCRGYPTIRYTTLDAACSSDAVCSTERGAEPLPKMSV